MSEQKTYYRCSGYVEEKCAGCELGNPHEYDEGCCTIEDNCIHNDNKLCTCVEYDRDPCGNPTCPDCTGGDGVSCRGEV